MQNGRQDAALFAFNGDQMKLKRRLFDEYDGFADKRIKKLEKGTTFIVDDRSDRDIGADKKLLSYFCLIFIDVDGDNAATVSLSNNMPIGSNVKKWASNHNVTLGDKSARFKVTPASFGMLLSLADAIESITEPGSPRYSIASYKYVCPRTAASLRRLHAVLASVWVNGKGIGFGL